MIISVGLVLYVLENGKEERSADGGNNTVHWTDSMDDVLVDAFTINICWAIDLVRHLPHKLLIAS